MKIDVVDILMVEDNRGDAYLVRESLRRTQVQHTLTVVEDGSDASDYLWHRGAYGLSTRPDLILLDVNVPRRNGREILGDLKADPDMRDIPVAVLTSSIMEHSIVQQFEMPEDAFVLKPTSFGEYVEAIKGILHFYGFEDEEAPSL